MDNEKLEEVQETEAKGPQVIVSPLKNFSKKEFVVLKGNVYSIQSITPKKLIFKLKGRNPKLPDGMYVVSDGK